jgi:hypothetical protein
MAHSRPSDKASWRQFLRYQYLGRLIFICLPPERYMSHSGSRTRACPSTRQPVDLAELPSAVVSEAPGVVRAVAPPATDGRSSRVRPGLVSNAPTGTGHRRRVLDGWRGSRRRTTTARARRHCGSGRGTRADPVSEPVGGDRTAQVVQVVHDNSTRCSVLVTLATRAYRWAPASAGTARWNRSPTRKSTAAMPTPRTREPVWPDKLADLQNGLSTRQGGAP